MPMNVLLERDGAIATLTLNRMERHNSLVPEFLRAMLSAIDDIKQSDARVMILQANGRSFSTGGDVQAFYDHRDNIEPYANEIVGALNQVIVAMIALPQPIVGAVHGIVTGGSVGLVLACDVVLLAPQASFTPYYSVVGFSPDGGWTALLPNKIGAPRAARVLMRNETITSEQAVAWGIANGIVPSEKIRDEARAVANDIAAKKLGSIQRTKCLLWGDVNALAARLEAERREFVQQIVTPEAQQGIAEFLQKR
ncbi:MAG: enoyl-CoA hydratase/isomerase family protein [Chloroflexi bacterium]|nr:enoyl-CoA hydratase/isomerase family protein [Chloroflexota bacterium]